MRNKLGKPFGPPPKRGPNPQVPPVKLKKGGFDPEGIKKGKRYYSVKKKKEGGLNRDERFMGFLSKQFNQNKDRIIKEVVLPGLIRKDFGARVKNLMNQAVRDFDAQEGEAPYTMNFVAYNPKKEETGITTKETMGLKKGKMVGCPHRERGARSDIKGISKIQVKGKKFTGVF
tara:strand:+ start:3392 stop:3910 length:519 start_codon:yes stop_codon:yes gene_type:complete